MTDVRRLTRDMIAAEPWGAAYLREMDLIIATNELESAKNGRTLYNAALDLFVAERCAPLDGGLELKRLTDVDVPSGDRDGWARATQARQFLKNLPRGHWAVFNLDGAYDAYMSDGRGGIGTQAGSKFNYYSPNAKDFNGTKIYGHLLSMITYLRRNEINNRIMDHTFQVMELRPGQVFKNTSFGGRTYSKVQYVGVEKNHFVGGGDAIEFTAIRRGAGSKKFTTSTRDFARLVAATPVMPPEFVDNENDLRLIPEFRSMVVDTPDVEVAGLRPF